ncbi:polymorphic toxin-type HINT domain-containing protein, partial [Streptosporangium sp. NPDC006007]|uniref:polymorphic toxin-type HINT domain-containing protein n=1 Tax=Streptosporangium sp. NPDC006007 TaxID=3154575 RepID=UPI0033B4FFE5
TWVPATRLTPGAWLRTSTGTHLQITAIAKRTVNSQRVHNLTIADTHTYHVGAGVADVLVHNANCPRDANGRFTSGENVDAARGRLTHKNYRTALGSGYKYEERLPSGGRPDAIDWKNRVVRELKSDAPSSIATGRRQLARYVAELERITGKKWNGILDIYKR